MNIIIQKKVIIKSAFIVVSEKIKKMEAEYEKNKKP